MSHFSLLFGRVPTHEISGNISVLKKSSSCERRVEVGAHHIPVLGPALPLSPLQSWFLFSFPPDRGQFLCSFPSAFLLLVFLLTFLGILRECFKMVTSLRNLQKTTHTHTQTFHSNKLGLMWSFLSQIRLPKAELSPSFGNPLKAHTHMDTVTSQTHHDFN